MSQFVIRRKHNRVVKKRKNRSPVHVPWRIELLKEVARGSVTISGWGSSNASYVYTTGYPNLDAVLEQLADDDYIATMLLIGGITSQAYGYYHPKTQISLMVYPGRRFKVIVDGSRLRTLYLGKHWLEILHRWGISHLGEWSVNLNNQLLKSQVSRVVLQMVAPRGSIYARVYDELGCKDLALGPAFFNLPVSQLIGTLTKLLEEKVKGTCQ